MFIVFFLQIKEETVIPEIKLEPHEVDQFLNLSPKGQTSDMNLSLCSSQDLYVFTMEKRQN